MIVLTKTAYEAAREKLAKEDSKIQKDLSNELEISPPVYFCTVEPNSESEEKRLHFALECLQREDPSLKVLFNNEENYGQTIIQGIYLYTSIIGIGNLK
jgi:elongation factor G